MKFTDKIKFWIKQIYIDLNLKFLTKKNKYKNDEIFYVFLDLLSFRCTWDIIGFLILAKINSGNKKVKIVVLPEINLKFDNNPPKEKSWLKKNSKKIRFDNIIKPCFEIIEDLDPAVLLLNDRKEANEYINKAKYKFPEYAKPNKVIDWDHKIYIKINDYFKKNNSIPSLKAPEHYCNLVNEYILNKSHQKKIVTITIKDSSFTNSKNSNLIEWLKVYDFLNNEGYHVIILDDFENVAIENSKNEINKLNHFKFANLDIRVRLALYEKAYINLCVNNGTAQLLNYSKYCKFISFKHYVNDPLSSTSLENIKKITGLNKDDQYPFHNKTQKTIWDPIDSCDLIKDEFKKLIKEL